MPTPGKNESPLSEEGSEERTLERRVLDSLNTLGVQDGQRILAAVSGGADSMFLLTVLCAVGQVKHLSVGAVHINHGIRAEEENLKAQDAVTQYCEQLNVHCIVRDVPQGQILSEAGSEGIESAARKRRYEHFTSCMSRWDWLATGHNRDDQNETLLMRFFQGNPGESDPGIPGKRDYFIRPILDISRQEIAEYIRSKGIPFVTDSSNNDNRYLRNSVRNLLIPAVKQVFPGYEKALRTWQKHSAGSVNYSDFTVRRGDEYHVNGDQFLRLPENERIEVLLELYSSLGNEQKSGRISRESLRTMQRQLLKDQVMLQNSGITIIWDGTTLVLSSSVVQNRKKGYLIRVMKEGVYSLSENTVSIRFGRTPGKNEYWVLKDRISFPLILRNSRPDDTIRLKEGSKAVRDLLKDRGLQFRPEQVPLLEDQRGICALFGKLAGSRNIYDPHYRGESGDERLERREEKDKIIFAFKS